VHAWQLSPETEGYVLFFSLEFYLLGHPLKKLQQFPFYSTWLQKPLLLLKPEERSIVSGLLDHMETEYESRHWKQEDIIRDYLDILFIQLTRFYQAAPASSLPAGGTLSELQQLVTLIDLHFKQHEPVSFYADQLHVTPKQLNEVCRQALSKTTTELIQERVILEARRLLLHSDLTITQIASELGYFDNSYFTRFFKKNTGQTPEQFRQSLK
jgi:AraC family transcriptional activator of pobA